MPRMQTDPRRDIPRALLCTCGWSGVFPTLKAANTAAAYHVETGCEGADHAFQIHDRLTP